MGLISIVSTTKARLFTFLGGKTAKSAEVNSELNQIIAAHNQMVTDVTNINNAVDTVTGVGWTGQTLVSLNTAIVTDAGNLVTHKASADHDTRYNTKAEVGVIQTALQDQITADATALVTHKTSADHDGRYFTEAEVTAIQGALQGQINTTAATLTTLQNQLNALDTTFSTDAERLAAIQNVITSFNLADDDLEALIVGKANSADVYSKAQIDAMTLGSYKFGFFKNQVTLVADETVVAVGIPEWNPIDDPLLVYVGGLYQTEGTDYTIDTVNKTILGSWLTDYVIDFFVVKNLRVVDVGDYFDGYLLTADSVQRTALAPAVRDELDGMRNDIDVNLYDTLAAVDASQAYLQGMIDNKTVTGSTLYMYNNLGGGF